MIWSPTVRRRALSGLASLWHHQEWRASEQADEIRLRLLGVLADQDEVVRYTTAQVASLLGDGLELIAGRLLVERHREVAAVLMAQLHCFRESQPERVDGILAAVIELEPWRAVLAQTDDDRDECFETISVVAVYLAVRWQAPTAVRLADGFFANPTAGQAAERAVYAIRGWLKAGPELAEERRRAFALLRLSGNALEQARVASQYDREMLRKADQYADTMVTELYFASGARDVDGEPAHEPDQGFAGEAFAVLDLLTGFKSPSIVHRAVETLVHLAPVDPVRALLLVDAFVKSGDLYTYDPLATAAVIGLIERYLAEFREHLTANPELLDAIRSLLNALVRVGWPDGVALTYRLGDAFR